VSAYRVTVKLKAQIETVTSSITSATFSRLTAMILRVRQPGGDAVGFARMEQEPTRDNIDALVGPATPHFAYQLRARVRELIGGLPDDHPVRRYGEEKMELLERLGYASSKAEDLPTLPRDRGAGWEKIPSSAPASDPLPRDR
jgi:hypothetical protein